MLTTSAICANVTLLSVIKHGGLNMKKILLSTLILAGIIAGANTSVFAEGRIAVINTKAVVQKSAQLQALNKEQQTKLKDLEKWIQTCQADIAKQQTQAGKEKLAKKYDAELKKKQEAITTSYKEKIKVIDKSISDTIAAQARAKGYDMVISKDVVMFGGDDITESVLSVVK
jgi:outer membrane protein